jgi:hypothetical protein
MSAWIIKTETYDPDLAPEIVRDQQNKDTPLGSKMSAAKPLVRKHSECIRLSQSNSRLPRDGKDYLLVWHPQRLLSVFFMWPGGIKSFATVPAASPRWPRSAAIPPCLGNLAGELRKN